MKAFKRALSLLLCVAMTLSGMVWVPVGAAEEASRFKDMKGSEYYAESVELLAALSILTGYKDGTFGAKDPISRAEMAAIICRLIDKEEEALASGGKTEFKDVSDAHWASGYINVASDAGIINGDGNGLFRPEDEVTYEEAVKMVVCACGFAAGLRPNASDWSAPYLKAAEKNGLLKDVQGKKGEASTRGDVAVMAANALKADLQAPHISLEEGTYYRTKTVELTTETADADIYYTLDGSKPTTNSEKYTEAISISDSATLKAVTVKRGVLYSPVSKADYVISRVHGKSDGGSDSSKPSKPSVVEYTVSFDLNYEGATGAPESQTVKKGETVAMPDDPEHENFAFMGWHTSSEKVDYFDFQNSSVTSNITIYAHWVDITDETDTDSDGLSDAFEVYFGTDLTNADTDGDNLNDYFELFVISTNPLLADTDNNGITDDLEDIDGDGLNNAEEVHHSTNALFYDTDHDSLSDYDEINIYRTDPLCADTDGDGVTDGDEIAIGTDPLVVETVFSTRDSFGELSETNPISICVNAITDSNGAATLEIEPVTQADNYLINDAIAGYLGYAYDLSIQGELLSAELIFSYDESLGEISDTFQPRIYYLNESTQELEELPNQTVTNGCVKAETTHFSTYILLNKVEFDTVWNTEIKPPVDEEDKSSKNHIDIVFAIDSSGSMMSNDSQNIRKKVAKEFVSKFSENDMAAVVDFDSNAKLNCGLNSDKSVLNAAIDKLDSSGGTNIGKGIKLSIDQFIATDTYNPDLAYKYIVMLTDGQGSYDDSLTNIAKDKDIVIYTIGLGNGVNQTLLEKIAEGTGGKYYFATLAEELNEIFDAVAKETIDYTTDSNNDGISDYYTKLINDGVLRLTNTSSQLMYCTEIFGEESDDWDGDGLLNGEEIEIVIGSNGEPKIKMNSHPFFVDYDCDQYNDYQEKYIIKSDPLKYSLPHANEYEMLMDSSKYIAHQISDNYINASWFEKQMLYVSDWNKTEQAEKVIIDYFYDFASQKTIDKNQESIENQLKFESIVSGTTNILKIIKNLKSITDLTTGISELDRKTEKVRNFKYNTFKGLKEVFASTNQNDINTALGLMKNVVSDVDKSYSVIEEWGETADSILESVSDISGDIVVGLSVASNVLDAMYKDGKWVDLKIDLPIPKSFKHFSEKYTKWNKDKAGDAITHKQVVSIVFDVVDFVASSAESYTTYSKIIANLDAFDQYLDVIENISENGKNIDFVQNAAWNVRTMIVENGIMDHWKKVVVSNSPQLLLKIGMDILSKHPYVALIKAVTEAANSIIGLTKTASTIVTILAADSISDSFAYELSMCSTKNNGSYWFTVNSYENGIDYLTNLAQCRIYAENIAMEAYTMKTLGALVTNIIRKLFNSGLTDKEVVEIIKSNITDVYNSANQLNLTLSNKLPSYRSGGGGGNC